MKEQIKEMKEIKAHGAVYVKTKRRLLVVLGFVLLAVGALGIFLPILPTTPLVLAAAGCFSGNPKLTAWLRRSPFFADYITCYKKRKGLKKSTVIISLVFLWAMLVLSVFRIQTVWSTILFSVVGLAVTIHIVYISRPKKNI